MRRGLATDGHSQFALGNFQPRGSWSNVNAAAHDSIETGASCPHGLDDGEEEIAAEGGVSTGALLIDSTTAGGAGAMASALALSAIWFSICGSAAGLRANPNRFKVRRIVASSTPNCLAIWRLERPATNHLPTKAP
jgi:hypothetical protein